MTSYVLFNATFLLVTERQKRQVEKSDLVITGRYDFTYRSNKPIPPVPRVDKADAERICREQENKVKQHRCYNKIPPQQKNRITECVDDILVS